MNWHRMKLFLGVLIASWLPTLTSVAQVTPSRLRPFGLDAFRLMIAQSRLKCVESDYENAFKDPSETVLIIIGDTSQLGQLKGRMERFYNGGGAIMIATDLGGGGQFGSFFDVRFVPFNHRNSFTHVYKFRDCPQITDFKKKHSLFNNVSTLVANRPGYLIGYPKLRLGEFIAKLPIRRKEARHLIYARQQDSSRYLAIADHSLFVNEMLMHGNNARFARNCIRWLANGSRDKVVLIRDNRVLPTYALGQDLESKALQELLDQTGSLPPIAPKVTDPSLRIILNNVLKNVQDKNLINESIVQAKWAKVEKLRRFFVVAIIGGIVLWFLRRVVMNFHQPWQSGRCPADSAADQRSILGSPQHADMQRGIRRLAQQFFSGTNDVKTLSGRKFKSRCQLSLFKKSRANRSLKMVWRIATGKKVVTSKKSALQKLQREITYLTQLQRDGKLEVELV